MGGPETFPEVLNQLTQSLWASLQILQVCFKVCAYWCPASCTQENLVLSEVALDGHKKTSQSSLYTMFLNGVRFHWDPDFLTKIWGQHISHLLDSMIRPNDWNVVVIRTRWEVSSQQYRVDADEMIEYAGYLFPDIMGSRKTLTGWGSRYLKNQWQWDIRLRLMKWLSMLVIYFLKSWDPKILVENLNKLVIGCKEKIYIQWYNRRHSLMPGIPNDKHGLMPSKLCKTMYLLCIWNLVIIPSYVHLALYYILSAVKYATEHTGSYCWISIKVNTDTEDW